MYVTHVSPEANLMLCYARGRCSTPDTRAAGARRAGGAAPSGRHSTLHPTLATRHPRLMPRLCYGPALGLLGMLLGLARARSSSVLCRLRASVHLQKQKNKNKKTHTKNQKNTTSLAHKIKE